MNDLAKTSISKNAVVTNDVLADRLGHHVGSKRIFKTFTDILGILEERWEDRRPMPAARLTDDLRCGHPRHPSECRVQKQFGSG